MGHEPLFGGWRPELLELSEPAGRERWRALAARSDVRVCDTLEAQLLELMQIDNPAAPRSERAIDQLQRWSAARGLGEGRGPLGAGRPLADTGLDAWGSGVYYPWSRRLVRALPEALFRRVRGARNWHKITPGEQRQLRGRAIGVVGLSVGRAIAVTLAMEGICGRIRLADMDTLGLSNLNRIRAPIWDLGTNKAILAARELSEIDPWLEIDVFTDGVTPENLEVFLDGLDLVIEEADQLHVKALVRERARAARIPVLMNTSDRGVTDVERYDLEPEAPLFLGRLGGGASAEDLAGLSGDERIGAVMAILDPDQLSDAAAASMTEIGATLTTWPQLASGVNLGGAIVTHVARRVLLGEAIQGRFYVDLEALIPPERRPPPPGFDPRALRAPAEALAARRLPEAPAVASGRAGPELALAAVGAAVLAPSAHNLQPWRFVYRAGGIDGHLVSGLERDSGVARPPSSLLAMGAAAENMLLWAWGAGIGAAAAWVDDPAEPERVLRLELAGQAPIGDAGLLPLIPRRVTNRQLGPREEAPASTLRELAAGAGDACALRWIGASDRPALERAMIHSEKLTFLCPSLFEAFFGGLRWTPEEALRTRDGLDAGSMNLSAPAAAAIRMLSRRPVVERLGALEREALTGAADGLVGFLKDSMAAASTVGLLLAPPGGDRRYLESGRALQRIWLRATALGWSLVPWLSLPMLLWYRRASPKTLGDAGCARVLQAEAELRSIGVDPGSLIGVLRLGRAPPLRARSLRRPAAEVFSIAD